MKWGVRNGPPYPIGQTKATSPRELSKVMNGYKYKNYTRLQSPSTTVKTKHGSCHDLSYLVFNELKRLGKKPTAYFVMEYDDSGQGGMTHSMVTYKENGVVNWIEPANAWSERGGITSYTNHNALVNSVKRAHSSGEYGDINRYPNIEITTFDFDKHIPGESLGDFVNKCLE